MGKNSKIEWTDHTFNPWWGCTKVSAACTNCYAEAFAKRTGNKVWGKSAHRRFFGDKHWDEPLKWNQTAQKAGIRSTVFCASMADIGEDRRDLDAHRNRLFSLVLSTPRLDWLFLSKHPHNLLQFFPAEWTTNPPQNLHVGTTVENQSETDRIGDLLKLPGNVHFISCEPLLGKLDLRRFLPALDWVIVGGESGPKARPMHPNWLLDLLGQCKESGVPFFFKQWGEYAWGHLDNHSLHYAILNDGSKIDLRKYLNNWSSQLEPVVMTRVGKFNSGRLIKGIEYAGLPKIFCK